MRHHRLQRKIGLGVAMQTNPAMFMRTNASDSTPTTVVENSQEAT